MILTSFQVEVEVRKTSSFKHSVRHMWTKSLQHVGQQSREWKDGRECPRSKWKPKHRWQMLTIHHSKTVWRHCILRIFTCCWNFEWNLLPNLDILAPKKSIQSQHHPDFIHNGACYPDFLSPRRVPMECRQSIHRVGGCHRAEINMLPMFFFCWRLEAPRSCNILLFKGYQNLALFNEKTPWKICFNVDDLRWIYQQKALAKPNLREACWNLRVSRWTWLSPRIWSVTWQRFPCHLNSGQYN